MTNALERLGRLAARRPWAVIGAWLIVAVLVIGAAATMGRQLEDSLAVPGQDSQRAAALLSQAGSDRAGPTAQVVATPSSPGTTFTESRAARAALAETRAALLDLPNVVAVDDTTGPAGGVSPDGRVALLRVQYADAERLGTDDVERLKGVVSAAGADSAVQVEANGDLFSLLEEGESGPSEMVGLLAAAIILLISFGSLVAVGLPIGTALVGLAVGIGGASLLAYLVDVPAWAPDLAVMIGLGVGIDYTLFLVARHREGLAQGLAVEDAIARAVATAGQAVVVAGGTVVIAILGLAVAGVPALSAAAVAISAMVLVMVVAAITLAPALLGLIGRRIDRLAVPGMGRAAHRAPRDPLAGRWGRWGRHVSRHAAAYALGTTLVLLAMAAPVLALRLGNPDQGTLPESRTERRAYDLIASGFGPGANSPLVIAVDTSGDPGVVAPLAAAVEEDPGVASVETGTADPESGVAALLAYPTTSAQDDATVATIARLRADVLPAALAGSPARAHVGGQTASLADVAERVSARLPLLVAGVVGLSFLLLVLVFRSILVPLKAALLNLLSVGAAYGVIVAVFQWGWGADLIGLETTIPVISFVPMFMFAILFGLSMDYEVFLLSRIREAYVAGDDNTTSVIRGIAGTARVITSAALIMVSVFLGFVLGEDPTIKMFGLGLATAILIDATVVRLLLVPATMTLLGDANWWLPRHLGRVLPRIAPEGQPAGAAPEVRSSPGAP